MVSGQPCPMCDAAPRMEKAGESPTPDGYRIIMECPACGYHDRVDPDEGPSSGFEW